MRLLVNGCTATVRRLAPHWPDALGHLLSPDSWNAMAAILDTGLAWAADNSAYSGFDEERFRRMLGRIHGHPRCLFVVCPDVVGDGAATLARFREWRNEVASSGQPVALVGQDGLERPPWDAFDAYFLGGTDAWKLSRASVALCREAKRRGKWLHVGRVNSFRRLTSCLSLAADSCDGTSMSMFGETYVPRYLRWVAGRKREGELFVTER